MNAVGQEKLQMGIWRMCRLDTQGFKYILRICNTYCSSTARVVAQTLYVHCLSCLLSQCSTEFRGTCIKCNYICALVFIFTNSEVLYAHFCICNFHTYRALNWKVWTAVHRHHKVKYDSANFHETSSWLINFYGRLVYSRFSKLDEKCSKYRQSFTYTVK